MLERAFFWDLPKAAYYAYHQNDAETNLALQQAGEDFAGASDRMIEAISASAGVAYEGLPPILEHACISAFYNGGEAFLDAGAVASIVLIEGGKLANNYVVSPVAARLAEAALALETIVVQQASSAYEALPSVGSLLPGFTTQISQNTKALSNVPEKGIEMSVISEVYKAAAAAA